MSLIQSLGPSLAMVRCSSACCCSPVRGGDRAAGRLLTIGHRRLPDPMKPVSEPPPPHPVVGAARRGPRPLRRAGGLRHAVPPHAAARRAARPPRRIARIKREIDTAFSEGAIDVARGVVKEMLDHTKDPERRAELEQALADIDEAREEPARGGREVIRAKREAAEAVTRARSQDATAAIARGAARGRAGAEGRGAEDETRAEVARRVARGRAARRGEARRAQRGARPTAEAARRPDEAARCDVRTRSTARQAPPRRRSR